jgi:hypothetical protein
MCRIPRACPGTATTYDHPDPDTADISVIRKRIRLLERFWVARSSTIAQEVDVELATARNHESENLSFAPRAEEGGAVYLAGCGQERLEVTNAGCQESTLP